MPDGFVFALKGSRYTINRRVLKEAGKSMKRFFDSGLVELGDRLGPMLWQLPQTKKFHADDFGGFLVAAGAVNGRPMRHAIEARHDSFRSREFIALLRKFERPAYTPGMPNIRRSPT